VVSRAGHYRVSAPLRITVSGIILRGENAVVVSTGQSRQALIQVNGTVPAQPSGPAITVAADAPAGTTQLKGFHKLTRGSFPPNPEIISRTDVERRYGGRMQTTPKEMLCRGASKKLSIA